MADRPERFLPPERLAQLHRLLDEVGLVKASIRLESDSRTVTQLANGEPCAPAAVQQVSARLLALARTAPTHVVDATAAAADDADELAAAFPTPSFVLPLSATLSEGGSVEERLAALEARVLELEAEVRALRRGRS
ncbi:MAG: hypothetical protein ABW217_16620 [Polyangiaceae bacterium]